MGKINVYLPNGLDDQFRQLATDLGFDSPSALCQFMATNRQSITAMLAEEYNGVDLQSLTEFINHVSRYNTEQIYALIANRPALERLLNQPTT